MAVVHVSRGEWDAARPWAADKVAIDGLQLVANSGFDGFGRPKSQPIQLNMEMFLSHRVSSAASADALDNSTVHYGDLSKTIVSWIQGLESDWRQPYEVIGTTATTALAFGEARSGVAALDLVLRYPKASLASTRGYCFRSSYNVLKNINCLEFILHQLDLQVLVGVNAHERAMKQKLLLDISIDRLNPHIANECYQVEQIVTKTVEESSFETLEALVETIAANVTKFFILAKKLAETGTAELPEPAGVRIRASKPMAITSASGAVVEVYRSVGADDTFGRKMATELGSKRPQIPFPLQERLDEFLQSWKQD